MAAEELAQIFQVIEGGAEAALDNIVQFPVDAAGAAAETALSGEGTTTLVQLGNGAAAEVSQLTVIEGGATAATTSGLGILALDVGVAGAAIAPALGVLAGVGLYNLAPEFWTDVADRLTTAGQTVGGKVRAFINGETRQFGLSETTIEIFKQALIDAEIFKETLDKPDLPVAQQNLIIYFYHAYSPTVMETYSMSRDIYQGLNPKTLHVILSSIYPYPEYTTFCILDGTSSSANVLYSAPLSSGICVCWKNSSAGVNQLVFAIEIPDEYIVSGRYYAYATSDLNIKDISSTNILPYTYKIKDRWWFCDYKQLGSATIAANNLDPDIVSGISNTPNAVFGLLYNGIFSNPNIQADATLPNANPFPQTYPEWVPWSPPVSVPWPAALPDIYPIEIPDLNPDIQQDEAQNPDPNPDPVPWLQFILDNVVLPDPITNPDPSPQPLPEPDPDPQPEPEPLPEPSPVEVDPDPPNPNPDPPVPPLPIVPVLPDMVPSNAMFTVYRPSLSQLNSFGGWLWDNNIIEQILKMWQNPLDGIIAFMKVYAEPSVGNSANIQVGYLDSGVSAPVVTSQFTTVDCGSVVINESKHNATDYSPYTSLHLYLPFIGIVELDADEFMGGTISISYHIDVYTGTCLAEVKCTRTVDMPNATIIYTFSGNASQQLPLTSSSFAGALSALVSAVGGGIAIASGGGVAALAGGLAIGHSLTHEMIHIGHSGALSANAGIMGSRKPYIIISRKHGYDANGYNELYGYPANKTVFLGNCTGFTRVKAGRLQSKASEKEKDEIMSLLKEGVIL